MNVPLPPSEAPAAARPRREPLWQRAGVALLAASCWLLAHLPGVLVYAIADLVAVAWCAFWFCNGHSNRSRRGYWFNVKVAFRPGSPLGPRRPRWHLWRWSRHLAWLAVDFCRLRRLNATNLEAHCDLSAYPPLRALYDEGKGIIFATGHIGVFEVAGYAAGLLGLPIRSVYRPSPIPALDRWIQRSRSGSGQTVVAQRNVMWTLKKALANGEVVGLLCDSGARHAAVWAPFLGTLASTVATPAILQLATGAPIAVVTVQRTGRLRFRVHVHDVLRHAPTGNREADLLGITTRINDGLTRGVAVAPEQWFWQTRRFRHRPPGEQLGSDGLPPLAPSGRP